MLRYCLGLGFAPGFSKTRKYGAETYDRVVMGTLVDEQWSENFRMSLEKHCLKDKLMH